MTKNTVDVIERLRTTAAIAHRAEEYGGFTRLNDPAREMLKEAANEIERLRKLISEPNQPK